MAELDRSVFQETIKSSVGASLSSHSEEPIASNFGPSYDLKTSKRFSLGTKRLVKKNIYPVLDNKKPEHLTLT
jgi:hypothetical protein